MRTGTRFRDWPVTALAGAILSVAGCSMSSTSEAVDSVTLEVQAPLPSAHCSIYVDGRGWKDMETDYLPRVIACENGAANLQALKAQAIAARSVAYYYIETQGSVCDGQGCQVYTCGVTPQSKHYQAVSETAGQYMLYNNTLTYGFYVAGDPYTSAPSCVGSTANSSTEGYVTYNQGKTGTGVRQTSLGWIHSPGEYGYGQNRGCMSQNGAKCLENQRGFNYVDILRFYYGADIVLQQASGTCVGTPPPSPTVPDQVTGLNPDGWVNVGSSSVYLTWNPSARATNYDVTFLYWNGSQWLNYYTWNTTNTYFTAWPVYHDTYYAWTVKARNSAGQAPQSEWAYFFLD
jgi:hypothetical protein